MDGFSPDEEIELFELDDGDIICFQKPLPADRMTGCRYPDVPSFLEYVLTRWVYVTYFLVVCFHYLEKLKEDDFSLELSKVLTFDNVTERIAWHLVLDDPTKIILTPHNCCSQQPIAQAIKYQGFDRLSEMLIRSLGHPSTSVGRF
ncbi:hypothetical protein MKW98_009455 [Papaver atlanticum]|uniref:Ubiquitin carboxyl-terminal hydrolase 7 ICP0-binding domain-containing protein n=1 Tax=Papaver atlanticum TaxID=357466 RepID=A0AAD4SGD3_9MAGN|nr:hypothetical protein MKW98_009455 [Papaver atlanticum]